MKKKQLITILVMLIVVAGLAAGYVIAKNNNARKLAEEAEKEAAENATIPIYEIDTEAVEKISYKNEVADITVVRDGDIWIEEEKDVPMNMEYVQNMLDAVSSTVAIKVIREEPEDLAEFGLDKPVIEYTITLSDGTEHFVKLGDALVTETEGFYAQFGEDNTVYSVSSNYYVPFTHSYVEMIDIVDEVNITADYVTNVSITSKSDINFEAKYIGDESDSDEYYKWEIVKPYKYIYDGNWLTDSKYMVIHRLAVKKANYHQGIAKELIQFAIDKIKKDNINSIRIDTKIENIRMISLLQSFNFKIVGKIDLLRKDCIDKVRLALEYVQ